jgi:hypothetical protein
VLLILGPGLGLTSLSPWSFNSPSPTAFGTGAAIWLIVTQWLSPAFGGYLTGRLCPPLHQDRLAAASGDLATMGEPFELNMRVRTDSHIDEFAG